MKTLLTFSIVWIPLFICCDFQHTTSSNSQDTVFIRNDSLHEKVFFEPNLTEAYTEINSTPSKCQDSNIWYEIGMYDGQYCFYLQDYLGINRYEICNDTLTIYSSIGEAFEMGKIIPSKMDKDVKNISFSVMKNRPNNDAITIRTFNFYLIDSIHGIYVLEEIQRTDTGKEDKANSLLIKQSKNYRIPVLRRKMTEHFIAEIETDILDSIDFDVILKRQ